MNENKYSKNMQQWQTSISNLDYAMHSNRDDDEDDDEDEDEH